VPEVIGDAAILVDPTDVAQIAGAMRLVLTQPALAAALRAKGLARAARFTWERTARETIAVYERVLGGGGW
jgi:glycosyltransferase involved in cell wall biosynthesis